MKYKIVLTKPSAFGCVETGHEFMTLNEALEMKAKCQNLIDTEFKDDPDVIVEINMIEGQNYSMEELAIFMNGGTILEQQPNGSLKKVSI